ncbi:MAG: hypothetical protein ACLQFR_05420 [Streptosporangiaceae bacterium]
MHSAALIAGVVVLLALVALGAAFAEILVALSPGRIALKRSVPRRRF